MALCAFSLGITDTQKPKSTYRKIPTKYKEINPSLYEILCLLLPFKSSNFKNFILVLINKLVNLNCSPSLGLHKKSRFSQFFEVFLLGLQWSPNRLSPQLPRFNLFYFTCSLHLSFNVKSLSHLWIWIITIVKCRWNATHLIRIIVPIYCMFSKTLEPATTVRENQSYFTGLSQDSGTIAHFHVIRTLWL